VVPVPNRSRPRTAETNLTLTVGGGVDFRIWRGFAIGPSIRYIRLFGNGQDRDLTRIGARASYRF
jgi:opacity protein-like surface antigen